MTICKFCWNCSYMYCNRKAERSGTRKISKIYRALVTGLLVDDKVILQHTFAYKNDYGFLFLFVFYPYKHIILVNSVICIHWPCISVEIFHGIKTLCQLNIVFASQVIIDQPIGIVRYPGVAKGLYVASPSGLFISSIICSTDIILKVQYSF